MRPYAADSPWDLDPSTLYLTHGTYGACPRPVLEARRAMLDELESNPIEFLSRDLEERWDAARRSVAGLLNADPEGTVVVPNATTGVATVLASLRLRPGDELLTDDHEYNATLNALATTAERARARVVTVPIPLPIRHPEEVVEAFISGVTPRTRLALVSHVTSPSGLVFPIETIVRELDRLGVDTLVDAAHAPGMVPVDIEGLGAAYWTGNGHKWLCGPKTSGVLAVREDRRSGLLPLVTSHGRNDPRTHRPALWKEFDWQGTLDPTAFLALPEAIRLIGGLDAGGGEAYVIFEVAERSLELAVLQDLPEQIGCACVIVIRGVEPEGRLIHRRGVGELVAEEVYFGVDALGRKYAQGDRVVKAARYVEVVPGGDCLGVEALDAHPEGLLAGLLADARIDLVDGAEDVIPVSFEAHVGVVVQAVPIAGLEAAAGAPSDLLELCVVRGKAVQDDAGCPRHRIRSGCLLCLQGPWLLHIDTSGPLYGKRETRNAKREVLRTAYCVRD